MSSDLYLLDGSFALHSPEINPFNIDLGFFPDPFSPFPDVSMDTLQTLSDSNDPDQLQLSPSLFSSTPTPFLSSSYPPSHKIHGLSLNSSISAPLEAIEDSSVLNMMGVKTEFNADLESECPSLFSDRYNVEKERLMQRSLSSQSLDRKPDFLFQPHFSSLLESPKFETQMPNLSRKFEGPMRRASSTGDLHRINSMQSNYRFSTPLATHNSYIDEGSAFRVGRYSAEERKQRIHRYRSKRTQRNFNKTIKYACRKTLADSRPRVRGRFARHDETEEINKATISHREEYEEVLWVDRLNGEEEEVMALRSFANGMNSQFQQFQYLGI